MTDSEMISNFEDWASHLISEKDSKSDGQLEYEIVEALTKAYKLGAAKPQTVLRELYETVKQRELIVSDWIPTQELLKVAS